MFFGYENFVKQEQICYILSYNKNRGAAETAGATAMATRITPTNHRAPGHRAATAPRPREWTRRRRPLHGLCPVARPRR
jgi:hypothetical protein